MADASKVCRASFDDRLPWLAGLHTPDDDRAYFYHHVFGSNAVWGAFETATLVGVLAFKEGWIEQMYVLPGYQSRGVGKSLLNIAKASERSLRLWTFAKNEVARAFYEAHGFVVVAQTDGSDNDEREPDVLYEWTKPH